MANEGPDNHEMMCRRIVSVWSSYKLGTCAMSFLQVLCSWSGQTTACHTLWWACSWHPSKTQCMHHFIVNHNQGIWVPFTPPIQLDTHKDNSSEWYQGRDIRRRQIKGKCYANQHSLRKCRSSGRRKQQLIQISNACDLSRFLVELFK